MGLTSSKSAVYRHKCADCDFLLFINELRKTTAFRTLIDLCILAIKYIIYYSSFKVPSQLYWDFILLTKFALQDQVSTVIDFTTSG